MKKFLLIGILFIFGLTFWKTVPVSLADETASPAAKLKASGVKFPIAELGNCYSMASCKQFCDQAENRTACSNFALKYKLVRDQLHTQTASLAKEKFLVDAKAFLGCSDYNSCRTFCANPLNHQKCADFARNEGVSQSTASRPPTSFTQALFAAAKLELGCDSEDLCKAFCDQTPNYQRCLSFARGHQLGSGQPQGQNLPPMASPSGVGFPNQRPNPTGSYTYPPATYPRPQN